MTDCANETLRDLLPELAHDALSAADAARVRAHIDSCAACAEEFKIISAAGQVFASVTPTVDVAAIMKALPATPSQRPMLTVERTARRRFAMPRYALATAASLLIVATLALPTIFGVGDGDAILGVDTLPMAPSVPVAILGASTLDDLGAAELEALLADLETMEATVSAEPLSDRQPITSTPEGI